MIKLHYLIGDATIPIKKPAMIAHCCNDVGGFGKGFVKSLSERFPKAKQEYYHWFDTGKPQLGDVQFVQVTPEVCVVNMIGQHGIRWEGKIPPIRYGALENCLKKAYEKALADNLTFHGPRFGAVLSGGDWNIIEGIIKRNISVETFIYTLAKDKNKWPSYYEKS
jgi:hypothetical protein